jgi:coenzyme PQQ precursor peptide PqqA
MARSGHPHANLSRIKALEAVLRFGQIKVVLCEARRRENLKLKVNDMTWTTPVFEEVSLCCEINSYASAQL